MKQKTLVRFPKRVGEGSFFLSSISSECMEPLYVPGYRNKYNTVSDPERIFQRPQWGELYLFFFPLYPQYLTIG